MCHVCDVTGCVCYLNVLCVCPLLLVYLYKLYDDYYTNNKIHRHKHRQTDVSTV